MAEGGPPDFYARIQRGLAGRKPNFELRAEKIRSENIHNQLAEQVNTGSSTQASPGDIGRMDDTGRQGPGGTDGPVVTWSNEGAVERIADAAEAANLTRTMDEISEFDDAGGGGGGEERGE